MFCSFSFVESDKNFKLSIDEIINANDKYIISNYLQYEKTAKIYVKVYIYRYRYIPIQSRYCTRITVAAARVLPDLVGALFLFCLGPILKANGRVV